MKIDAHQHFWVYNKSDYGWINQDQRNLQKDFLPPDLKPLLNEIGFDGSVVVQARQTLEETRWLLNLAENHSWIKGVVGWVDLCSDDVEAQLKELAKNPLLRGVRHVIHDELDDQFMLTESFKRGISKLKSFGLTYDLLLFPKHLPYAMELVKENPSQPFVLDHISKPNIRDKELSPWRENIMQIAKHGNVFCKLSGMVTEASIDNWVEEDFAPYLNVVFEAFGPDRLMIGSDWPVCNTSGNYQSVMNIVLNYIKRFSPSDQEKILGQTCAKFYKLI